MFNLQEATLENLFIHRVGNKTREEPLSLSKKPVPLKDEITRELLLKYYLLPFKEGSYFHFSHSSDLLLNELYTYSAEIFRDPSSLFIQSVHIANHLYEHSIHPHVLDGELHIAYLNNCTINGENTDAIGIFKSENKETFLKIYPENDGYGVDRETGININRLDKGCLIFNLEKEKGYVIKIADPTNKGQEARYWKDDFLSVKPREDSFYHTHNFMQVCHGFCEDVLSQGNKVEKADQIMVKNKSLEYFQDNEIFNIRDFETKVLPGEPLQQAFRKFRDEFTREQQLPVLDEFDISKPAFKKGKKVFKSVIKLDKNFHIYVHGNREMITKDFDESTGMHFYQLFFREES